MEAENYQFEQGPIRPPSEAQSLLLRITRNCPWNQCTFCSLYKGQKFSIRSHSDILMDLESLKMAVDYIRYGEPFTENMDPWITISAENWVKHGLSSVFLQDANTLIVKPDDLISILNAIREYFPEVKRITSYARSQTIARISDEDLKRLSEAGLNRIHIGMESGSDEILKSVKKGVDQATHILAGQKVKRAGIELSEYIMPGLGGSERSSAHARETASALNQINPDFIRIRTLALAEQSQLALEFRDGSFSRAGDLQVAKELLLLIQSLEGISSTILSDHILNLLPGVEGIMPGDKDRIMAVIQNFIDLDQTEQMIYIIGRRLGIMSDILDLKSVTRRRYAMEFIDANLIRPETVDAFAAELMKRYI